MMEYILWMAGMDEIIDSNFKDFWGTTTPKQQKFTRM
jgi:hypothetical protein